MLIGLPAEGIVTMARYLILLIGTLTAFRAFGADSYLCVTDLLTGFSFDKGAKQWREANFNAREKFIISKADKEKYAWEVKVVGESAPYIFCENDFNDYGVLYCEGSYHEIRFNNTNLRFLFFHSVGYWNDGDAFRRLFPDSKEGDNTPAIGIGKCSPI